MTQTPVGVGAFKNDAEGCGAGHRSWTMLGVRRGASFMNDAVGEAHAWVTNEADVVARIAHARSMAVVGAD
jgi:hypothetical protein